MPVRFVTGDATQPQMCPERNYILHVCNNRGGWGAGFTGAISKRWSEPEEAYRDAFQHTLDDGDETMVGGISDFVNVGHGLYVVNMIAQDGYKSRQNGTPLNYGWLEKCLRGVAEKVGRFPGDVHMPMIGSGLAGGDPHVITEMVDFYLDGLNVTIYELPSKNNNSGSLDLNFSLDELEPLEF